MSARNYIYFIYVFLVFTTSCKSSKNLSNQVTDVTLDEFINAAITDFTTCRLFAKSNVYMIGIDSLKGKKIGISILEWNHPYYSHLEARKNLTLRILPKGYVEVKNSLFTWREEGRVLTMEAIKLYDKYKLLVPIEDPEDNFLDMPVDDAQEGADYYFCLSNKNDFKRIINTWGIGEYKPPKLKCGNYERQISCP